MTDDNGQDRIAIIGMGIRLPGAGRDLDRFWQNIETATEAMTSFERDDLRSWGYPDEVIGHFTATGVIPRFVDELREEGVQIPSALFQRTEEAIL